MADTAFQRKDRSGQKTSVPRDGVSRREARNKTRANRFFIVPIFIISLAIPASFFIASIRLSPYRIVLIAMLVPTMVALLSGVVGRLRPSDILMFLFGFWGSMSLFVTTPFNEALQPAGIFFIESFGAYLIGRVFISDERSFRAMVRFVFVMLMLLFPFAVFESVTGRPILLDLMRPFMYVVEAGDQQRRLGLRRAQVVFEHPILYGAFASSLLGLAYYAIRTKAGKTPSVIHAAAVALASALSLSSGAIAAMVVQIIFIVWDHLTKKIKKRWGVLAGLFVALYLIVDLLSNRTPFHVIVSYLTFSSGSSYNRILIWQYGSAEMWRHPIFGIGLADWTRPVWMSASMDNFWLVIAVQHGIPVFLFLASAFVFMMFGLGKANLQTESLKAGRIGFLVSMGGLIVAGATVDYWNAVYCWLVFLLGSGMWMLNPANQTGPSDHTQQSDNTPVTDRDVRPRSRGSNRYARGYKRY